MDNELISTLWGLLLLGAALLPSLLRMKKKRDEARRQAGRSGQTVGHDEYARIEEEKDKVSFPDRYTGQAAEAYTWPSPDEKRYGGGEENDAGPDNGRRGERGFTTLEEGRNDNRSFTTLDDRRSDRRHPAAQDRRRYREDDATMQRDRDYTAQDDWATLQPHDRQRTVIGEEYDFADTISAMETSHTASEELTRPAIREHRQAASTRSNGRSASDQTAESCEEEPLADFNLRHAVIYTEILKPKFGPQSEN